MLFILLINIFLCHEHLLRLATDFYTEDLIMEQNYNYEEELMIKIAWYYYIENLTQLKICCRFAIFINPLAIMQF